MCPGHVSSRYITTCYRTYTYNIVLTFLTPILFELCKIKRLWKLYTSLWCERVQSSQFSQGSAIKYVISYSYSSASVSGESNRNKAINTGTTYMWYSFNQYEISAEPNLRLLSCSFENFTLNSRERSTY